jgi:hypothetical protein
VTIDSYLAELERRLPRIVGRRPLAEVREHLRDSAATHEASGLSPAAAEDAAVRDFGPVDEIARRLGFVTAVRGTRIAAVVALATTAFFVVPLYVVPENTLPPAPWLEKPRDLALLQLVVIALWLVAAAAALCAAILAWTRLARLAAPMLSVALVALAGSAVAGAALTVRWLSYTASTASWVLAAPLAAACLVVCAGATAWSLSRCSVLARD